MLPGQRDKEGISEIVRDILRRYLPGEPEENLRRITERSGITIEELNKDNAPDFLEYLEEELSGVTEEWKAKFITGVIRQMISRAEQQDEGRRR
jgi:hypothetical protein